MEQWITELGIGGIFAILVIREVLNFLKAKNQSAKELISREEFDRHKKEVRYRDTCDDRHDSIQRQFEDIKADLVEIKQLIRNNHK